MTPSLLATAYIAAGVLFIMSLKGLSHPETARRGNMFGAIGMAVAVLAVILQVGLVTSPYVIGAVLVAALIGSAVAARVSMTAMPQLVALLHSFVGAAAVLVGLSNRVATRRDSSNGSHRSSSSRRSSASSSGRFDDLQGRGDRSGNLPRGVSPATKPLRHAPGRQPASTWR